MATMTIKMNKFKETKGTIVYQAETPKDAAMLRQQYIQKEAFDGVVPPDHIKVTIEAV